MSTRSRLEKWDRVGWAVAIIIAILLVGTALSTPSGTPAHAASHHHHSNKVSCDHHLWTRYVYIGSGRIDARMEVRMKACYRHIHLAHQPGVVLDKRTQFNVRFYNTAYGDTSGTTYVMYHNYTAHWLDNLMSTGKAKHIGYRGCLSVLGQHLCSWTADFVVAGQFNSPYITKHWKHSDGSARRWTFKWYQGEPGQSPGWWDRHVHMCKTMCR